MDRPGIPGRPSWPGIPRSPYKQSLNWQETQDTSPVLSSQMLVGFISIFIIKVAVTFSYILPLVLKVLEFQEAHVIRGCLVDPGHPGKDSSAYNLINLFLY